MKIKITSEIAPPLQMIQDTRGYVVLANNRQVPIGHVFHRFESGVPAFGGVHDIPVVVIGHTDFEDWNEQHVLVLGKPYPRHGPVSKTFFHRVVAE